MLLRRQRASRSSDRVSAHLLRSAFLRAVVIVVLLAALFGFGRAVGVFAALPLAPAARVSPLPVALFPLLALPFYLAR